MQYEIKDYRDEDGKKFVGFMITDDAGNRLATDKKIDLVDGKSDESYVSDAFALCKDEISEWQSQFALVGKKWNPDTNSFVQPEESEEGE